MKRCAALLLLASCAFAQEASIPKIDFQSVPNFLKLPQNMNFGEVAGVAVNSHKHIFVFSRGNTNGPAYGAAAAQLLEFLPNGTYVREIGHNLYGWSYAHSVKIDRHDNIWVADKGSDVVVKFNHDGRVAMVFGRKQEASDEETGPLKHPHPPLPPLDGMFRQVTDIAWDSAGNSYVTDGYINSRVAKYDKNGNWVKSWGEPETNLGNFCSRTALRWMRRTTSMSPIAATDAYRFLTGTVNSCGRSRSMSRSIRMRNRRSATSSSCRLPAIRRWRRDHRGRSALRRGRDKFCMPPTRIPAGFIC